MAKIFLPLFILIGLICLSSPIHATGNSTHETRSSDFECNLPAPGNFHAEEIGATYVDLVWDPVLGASSYVVKTYDDNNILISEIETSATAVSIPSLSAGVEYSITLAAKCGNGTLSPNIARVDIMTLIIDLIVHATDPDEWEYLGPCELLPWEFGSVYWVEVKQLGTNNFDRYKISYVESKHVQVGGPVPGGTLQSNLIDETGTPPPVDGVQFVFIERAEVGQGKLFQIELAIEGDNSIKICGLNAQSFQLYSFKLMEGIESLNDDDPPSDRAAQNEKPSEPSDKGQPEAGSTTVSNPFSEAIRVLMSPPSKEPVSVRLFNLDGSLALEQQLGIGQEQYSLPTADLVPGVYFLRLESAGQTQTFKVVKPR